MTPARQYLTPSEAAAEIEACYGAGSCSEAKIRRHIRDGWLEAEVVRRPCLPGRSSARPMYRIFRDQFAAYLEVNWPRAVDGSAQA